MLGPGFFGLAENRLKIQNTRSRICQIGEHTHPFAHIAAILSKSFLLGHILHMQQGEPSGIVFQIIHWVNAHRTEPKHVHFHLDQIRIRIVQDQLKWNGPIDRFVPIAMVVVKESQTIFLGRLTHFIEDICRALVVIEGLAHIIWYHGNADIFVPNDIRSLRHTRHIFTQCWQVNMDSG